MVFMIFLRDSRGYSWFELLRITQSACILRALIRPILTRAGALAEKGG